MNLAILIGGLPRDPELSYTANTQMAMCRFTVAVDRPKRNGEDAGTDYIRVVVWDRQAENCSRYLSKGSKVAVQGRIQTGSYKNQKGETVYTTDIVASRVEFLSSPGGQNSARIAQNYDGQRYSAPQANMMSQGEMSGTGFQQMDMDVPWEV